MPGIKHNLNSINALFKKALYIFQNQNTAAYFLFDIDTLYLAIIKNRHMVVSYYRGCHDCVSPVCYCGQDIETTTHFLLHCPNHHCARKTLFDKKNQVKGTILRRSDSAITKILLFGDNKLDFETNKILLMSKIEFI